jgi:hypothetical protein
VEELARLFVLALAVALVINLIQGGPGQAKRWLRAKMLGRV